MKVLPSLFALVCTLCVHAQPPGVKLPQPPNLFVFHANLWNLRPNEIEKEVSRKHQFQVWMKDSTSVIIDGKIEVDSLSYCLSWTDKTVKKSDSGRIKKIYPSQTRYIAIRDEDGSTHFYGPAAEDSWLFPVIEGRLTVYAAFAEKDLPDPFFLFVRNGDGPLMEMTMDNLADLLQGNEKAFALLKKGKLRKAIEKFNE